MNYRISRTAQTDLESICDYIAASNPDAADRLDEHIHKAIQRLADFPGLGHARPDVTDKRYLFWAVGNYVIAYRVEKGELVVVRVLHGARDFRRIFGRKQ
jgi:plasmid stabilization system protein ParE